MEDIEKRYEELEKRALSYNPALNRARLRSAFDYARTKHEGQLRKDGSPFVTHPLEVAHNCAEMGLDEDSLIAALLHDTIEDTSVTVEELRGQGFPEDILAAVQAVTKREGESYELFIRRAAGNAIGREVKMADLEDNMDIRRLDEIKDEDVNRLRKYLSSWHYLNNQAK